jgi:hypothetical protein
MPMFLIVIVIRTMIAVVQMLRNRKQKTKSESRCVTCAHAHVQYAANERRAISCTYGGSVRPMKLDVLYCTDYENRHRTVPVRSIGFVREIATTK